MSQTPPPPPPPGGGGPNENDPGEQPDYGQQPGGYSGSDQPAYGQEYGQPGYGGYPQPGQAPPPASGTNTKSVVALVLGILGFLCCGLVTGIPAIIVGAMARKETSQSGEGGSGMAMAGIVLGIIVTVLSIIGLILAIAGVIEFQGSGSTEFGGGDDF